MFVFDVMLDDENELKMFGYCVIGFTRNNIIYVIRL